MYARLWMATLVLSVVGWAGQADAGVKGKDYNVTVSTNFSDPFDDVWRFGQDNSFIISGGDLQGEFTQIDLVILSVFFAGADDGQGFSTQFTGLQLFSFLVAFGNGSEGETYQVVGSEAGPTRSAASSADYRN